VKYLLALAALLSSCGSPSVGQQVAPHNLDAAKELGGDFAGIIVILQSASSSTDGANQLVSNWDRHAIPTRLADLESSVRSLPSDGRIGTARTFYLSAIALLRPLDRSSVPVVKAAAGEPSQLSDITHRAEAEWKKGDDALK
jgi:hypothetical protein